MNNLDELMKQDIKEKLSKREIRKIIDNGVKILGKEKYLVICMEEISELIDVISENVTKKKDYIHTTEELVDVMICVNIIKSIYDIKNCKLDKVNKDRKIKKKNVVFTSIKVLAKSQQILSKCIRGRSSADGKIVDVVNSLNVTLYDLKKLFKIKEKDIDKMMYIKINRLNDRIKSNTLS